MKTTKFLKIALGLIVTFAMVSCVQDDDYTIPSSLGNEENTGLNNLLNQISTGTVELKTITEVRELAVQYEAISIESEIAVKGYVSSSDQTGNFYKEFFIQDDPSNPTATLKIVLNQVDTYNQFNQGREVYIYLKGLYIGETNTGDDVTTIGGKFDTFDNDVLAITSNQLGNHVFRSTTTEEIEPVELNLSEISEFHIGMFVKLVDVQFPRSLSGLPYVDPTDDFDSQRMIESCAEDNEFMMESSSFANFSQMTIPTDGKGTISGIINKTYDGYDLVINLISTDDVIMDDPMRCDPFNIDDYTAVFTEDFNDAVDNTNLNLPGWTNFAEEGSELWTEQAFGGNGYAEFSSYLSGDAVNVGWLVSPGIDMDAQEGEYLFFRTAQHHLDSVDNTLEVYVSSDFDGSNVLSATWVPITTNLADINNDWYDFIDSDLIDVSGYTGTLHVAFKVSGSGTNTQLDGAYHVEDFNILIEN